jgi:DNA polymerase III alpha subunit
MNPHSLNSYKTELSNRTLWYDGDITIDPHNLIEMIQRGVDPNHIKVTQIDDDIQRYNKLAKHKITIKDKIGVLEKEWNVELSTEKLEDYLVEKIIERSSCSSFSDEEYQKRIVRMLSELKIYKERNMINLLRVIIYVINTLEKHGIVWGVGRGSSVSSYILYLIGAHDVDSVEYDLDISDFIQ